MRRQLLHTQCDALFVVVEVQNHNVDFLIHFNHLLRVSNAAVTHVCDVYQPVDTSQIHKYAVRSDVFNTTLKDLADFETLNNEALLLLELSFNQSLVRNNYVLEFLIDFDNLEFHLLAYVLVKVPDWLYVYLRTWQERF